MYSMYVMDYSLKSLFKGTVHISILIISFTGFIDKDSEILNINKIIYNKMPPMGFYKLLIND